MKSKIFVQIDEAVVTDVPVVDEAMYRFPIQVVGKGGLNDFLVYVEKADKNETVDIHKDDKIMLIDAGFFTRKSKDGLINCLTVSNNAETRDKIIKIQENRNLGTVNEVTKE